MPIPRTDPCPTCGARRRVPSPAALRRARKAAGLTGRAMAALVDYSPSHISDIETGRRQATPALIAAYEALRRKENP